MWDIFIKCLQSVSVLFKTSQFCVHYDAKHKTERYFGLSPGSMFALIIVKGEEKTKVDRLIQFQKIVKKKEKEWFGLKIKMAYLYLSYSK